MLQSSKEQTENGRSSGANHDNGEGESDFSHDLVTLAASNTNALQKTDCYQRNSYTVSNDVN